MAKTIKFNLRFGNEVIRTIDDLKEYFVMEDVWEHFENGLLEKFLVRRGYKDEAQRINELANKKLREDQAMKELVSIFMIDADRTGNNAIDECAEIYKLRKKHESAYNTYAKGKEKEAEVIEKYIEEYDKTVDSIIEVKDNLGKIKAITKELLDTYVSLLKYDWGRLFYFLYNEEALYPICYMLTKEFFRDVWLIDSSDNDKYDEATANIHKMIDKKIKEVISQNDDTETNTWLKCSNKSEGDWEDIENDSRTKRYLVLEIPKDAKVRAYRDKDNELTDGEVNNKYISLNGIEYRSKNKNGYIYYTEV